MRMDSGGGRQANGLTNLTHRWGIVLYLDALANVIKYLLLALGELFVIHAILLDSLSKSLDETLVNYKQMFVFLLASNKCSYIIYAEQMFGLKPCHR